MGPYKVIAVKGHDRYDLEKCGNSEGPKLTSSSADNMKLWSTESESLSDEDYSSESDECQDGRVWDPRKPHELPG